MISYLLYYYYYLKYYIHYYKIRNYLIIAKSGNFKKVKKKK